MYDLMLVGSSITLTRLDKTFDIHFGDKLFKYDADLELYVLEQEVYSNSLLVAGSELTLKCEVSGRLDIRCLSEATLEVRSSSGKDSSPLLEGVRNIENFNLTTTVRVRKIYR